MSYYEEIDEQIRLGRTPPVKGQTYTTDEVYNKLALADSPFLTVVWDGTRRPVQTGHMSRVDIAKWIETCASKARWRYLRTTHEWIPLFDLSDWIDNPTTICEIMKQPDPFLLDDAESRLVVHPKGFPIKAARRPGRTVLA